MYDFLQLMWCDTAFSLVACRFYEVDSIPLTLSISLSFYTTCDFDGKATKKQITQSECQMLDNVSNQQNQIASYECISKFLKFEKPNQLEWCLTMANVIWSTNNGTLASMLNAMRSLWFTIPFHRNISYCMRHALSSCRKWTDGNDSHATAEKSECINKMK